MASMCDSSSATSTKVNSKKRPRPEQQASPREVLQPQPTIEISKEALNRLSIQSYKGPIHVVYTPMLLETARSDITSQQVVGFDTETR
jgi:hypothetical protein